MCNNVLLMLLHYIYTELACVYQNNTVYYSDNNTVSTHLMERGECRGRWDQGQCTVQLRTSYSHQVLVLLASF